MPRRTASALALGFLLFGGEASAATYTEDSSDIQNPERGFYRKGHSLGLLTTNYSTNAYRYSQIYDALGQTIAYMRMSLASYKNQDHLPTSLLNTIENNLENLRGTGVKAAIRFHYGEGSSTDASKQRMLNHIDDLAPLFHEYGDVIAYLEGGFVGDYGQWAKSESTDTDPTDDSTCGQQGLSDILDALLDAMPDDRMVLMAKPRMQGMSACAPYDKPVTSANAYNGSDMSRVGIYNDGMMCGKNNGNTFMCTRYEEERDYWAAQGDFTLMVGEGNGMEMGTCANDSSCPKGDWIPLRCDSSSDCNIDGRNYGPCVFGWNDCDSALEFAERHNVTAMDDGVNWSGTREVLDGLRDDTPECFDEFSRKLGYRYVLEQADWPANVQPNQVFNLSFRLRNEGYARLFNARTAYVTFLASGVRRDVPLASDPRRWAPHDADTTVSENIRVPGDLPPGTYEIAISLPDKASTLRSNPKYAIRFANNNTWKPTAGSNVLGTIRVTSGGTPPPPPPPTTSTTLGGSATTSTTTTTLSGSSVAIDTNSIRNNCAGGAGDTLTVASIPVGTQANRILVVGVGAEANNADCDLALSQVSVTYAGRTLTRAVSRVSSTSSWRACNGIFYLLNPPSGTANAVINFATNTSGAIDNRHAGAFVIYRAAQQAPVRTASSGADAISNPVLTSLDVPMNGAMVVDVMTQGEQGSYTAQTLGQTERWDRTCTSSSSAGSTYTVTSSGDVAVGWRHSSPRRYAHSVAAFRPAN